LIAEEPKPNELKQLCEDALKLCWQIERFPASELQTETVTMASAILTRLIEERKNFEDLTALYAIVHAQRDKVSAENRELKAKLDYYFKERNSP
jgi:hypothetical protein